MHATAQLNSSNTPIAETNTFQFVEGNVYFPPASIPNFESVLTPSSRTTQCPWKGTAQYYDLHVDGKVVNNAAWGYPEPKGAANHIKGFVAFDKSKVSIAKENDEDKKSHGSLMDKVKHVFK